MKDHPLQRKDKVIIEFTNGEAITIESALNNILALANEGQGPARYYISRIERYGFSDALANRLNEWLDRMEAKARPRFNAKSRELVWQFDNPTATAWLYNRDIEPTLKDIEALFAWMIAALISEDALNGLKRCALKDCQKYFVGGPRAKWCSENCGSLYRVRQKRCRDRERGMII